MDRPLQRHTPWGHIQQHSIFAEGIVFYSTASHGGFHVDEDIRASWHPALRDYVPYNGNIGWYEEDQDWCIVAMTIPDKFSPPVLFDALATFIALAATDDGLRAWLATDDGKALAGQVRGWEQQQKEAGNYRPGGSWGNGEVYEQSWKPYHRDLPRLITTHKGYPADLPALATRAELEAKYPGCVRREDEQEKRQAPPLPREEEVSGVLGADGVVYSDADPGL